MRLDLRFSNRPIEDLGCQALTALVFQDPDISVSPFFELNKKFSGHLAELVDKGLWTGEKGENLLLASQDTINADRLLVRGIGRREDFSISILENEVRGLGAVLDKIKVWDFGIHIPALGVLETEYQSFLVSSAIQLIDPFLKNHQDESEHYLKIVFSVHTGFLNFLSSVENRLREHFTSILDFSIVIDRYSVLREFESTA